MILIGKRQYKYKSMLMSHMAATSLKELHAFAALLKIHPRHFQNKALKPSRPHYDICQTKVKIALQHGAVLTDDREIIHMLNIYYNQSLAPTAYDPIPRSIYVSA